jgi:methyl-accepting chemotaxis protein
MMVAAPEAEATQAISHLSRLMLLVSISCLILACMAILILAKKFAKPITIMRDECLFAQYDSYFLLNNI